MLLLNKVMSWGKQIWLVGVVILVALILRVIGINYGLPHPYMAGGDEIAIVKTALAFGSGDLNPHYFQYPSLCTYILFFFYGAYYVLGFLAGFFHSQDDFARIFFSDPSAFYIIGRLIAAVAGTTTVLLVYLIGKKAYNIRTGIVAAVLLTFAPLHAEFSHMIKTQVPTAFLAALAFIFIYRVYEKGQIKDYILSGLFSGLCMATNYTGVFLSITILLAHCFHIVKTQGRAIEMVFGKRILLGAAFLVIGFFIAMPFALLDLGNFIQNILGTGEVYNLPSPWNDERLLYYPISLWKTMGPGAALLSMLGFIYIVFRLEKSGLLLLSFPVGSILFFSCFPHRSDYNMIPIFPLMVVVAARFLNAVIDKFRLSKEVSNVAIVSVLACTIFLPVYQIVSWDIIHSHTDTRTLAKKWIEQNVPDGSRILLDSGKYYVGTIGVPLNDSRENIKKKYNKSLTPNDIEKQFFEGARFSKYQHESTFYHYLLETVHDPSYNLVRMTHDHSSPYTDLQTLDFYRAKGIQYVIIISSVYRAYLSSNYPHLTKASKYRSFYASLGKKSVLLKEFPSSPDRPGPTIKIYKLNGK